MTCRLNLILCMNGSSILQDWVKVIGKIREKTNRKEQPYMHLLCIAYDSVMSFLPPFSSILDSIEEKKNGIYPI